MTLGQCPVLLLGPDPKRHCQLQQGHEISLVVCSEKELGVANVDRTDKLSCIIFWELPKSGKSEITQKKVDFGRSDSTTLTPEVLLAMQPTQLFDQIYQALKRDFHPSCDEKDLQRDIGRELNWKQGEQREILLKKVIPTLYMHDTKVTKNAAAGSVDFFIGNYVFEMKIIDRGSNMWKVDRSAKIIDDIFRCALISLDPTKVR